MDAKTILIGIFIGIIVGGALVYTVTPRYDPTAFQSQIEDLESSLSSLEDQNSDLQTQLSGLQDQISDLQSSLGAKESEIISLGDDVETLTAENAALARDHLSLSTDYSQLEYDYLELRNEYTRAEFEPIPPFNVQGKYVYDKFGRRVTIKGFALAQWKFAQAFGSDEQWFVKEDLQRIKDWGFHFVYSELWWGQVEPDQNQPGVYDYSDTLDSYHHVIDWCDEVNLNWIFRFRVSYEDARSGSDEAWWGWPTASYVTTEEGLERYCDFLKDTITVLESEHDNIVAYQPWQVPFHRPQFTEAEKTFFYERVIPEMVNAVRSVTSKPIIISPIDLGYLSLYKDFDDRFKVEDTNVIYTLMYLHPVEFGPLTVEDQPVWEGTSSDIEQQWNMLKPAVDFSTTYDVPLNVVEFGLTMERQGQLDKLELKLKLLDEYDIGWCYMWYSWDSNPFEFAVLNVDKTPKQGIVDLLIEYNDWG